MRDSQKMFFPVCKIFLTTLLLILSILTHAGAETTKKPDGSYKIFTLPDYDMLGRRIVDTHDGYVVAGSIYEDSCPCAKAWIIKIDRKGKKLWQKELGNRERASAFNKIVATDNGMFLAGSVDEKPGGPSEESIGWVVKLSPFGTVEWDRRLQFGRVTRAMDVRRTKNGVAVVGRVRQGEYEDSGFIAEFNYKGELLWTKHIQRPYWLDFVHPLKKGGFLTGNSGWIAVLDNSGNILWESSLSDYKYDFEMAEDSPLSRLRAAANEYKYDFTATVVELTNGDIILGGQAGQHIWMSRLSSGGKLFWNKKIEISGSCGLAGMWQYKEGLRAIGSTCGGDSERIWGASFSISGDIKAVRKYLTADVNKGEIEHAVPVEDDKFTAFGGAKDGKEGGFSIWVFESSFNFDAVKEK